MDSAIAKHLVCPRTRTRRVDDDYVPVFPAFSGVAAPDVTQVVMGYFGVQFRDEDADKADVAFDALVALLAGADAPGHVDYGRYEDSEGFSHRLAIAYWISPESFARWQGRADVAAWWASDQRLSDGVGYFREILQPRIDQLETAFGAPDRLEGVTHVMGKLCGPVQEHGYWGSMRDRIPLSQIDEMRPAGAVSLVSGAPNTGGRVVLRGHGNVAVIRSGQDWLDTSAGERDTYLGAIEPTLRAGMHFLRDEGGAIGCYSNRYVTVTDRAGQAIDKSFGLSHWRSLAHMERWAESHPTHLNIYVTFVELAHQVMTLRLFHEVNVCDAGAQSYEYINCHARTGLMRAL